MHSVLKVSTRRQTLLKLMPDIRINDAENLLRGLLAMADRLGQKSDGEGVVLYTTHLDVTAEHVRELFVGDERDRVTVDGVHTLMVLYRAGFFTGKLMQEPKMVSRIASHLQGQQSAA
jgi:hypothetical protein